jgi:hypothetical protein
MKHERLLHFIALLLMTPIIGVMTGAVVLVASLTVTNEGFRLTLWPIIAFFILFVLFAIGAAINEIIEKSKK